MHYAYPDIYCRGYVGLPACKIGGIPSKKPPLVISTEGPMAAPGNSGVVRRAPLIMAMRPLSSTPLRCKWGGGGGEIATNHGGWVYTGSNKIRGTLLHLHNSALVQLTWELEIILYSCRTTIQSILFIIPNCGSYITPQST